VAMPKKRVMRHSPFPSMKRRLDLRPRCLTCVCMDCWFSSWVESSVSPLSVLSQSTRQPAQQTKEEEEEEEDALLLRVLVQKQKSALSST